MDGIIKFDEQLCFGIYNANKKFNRFYQDVLSQYGLTYPQYFVLLVLWEHAPITVRELGSYVNLDSGTLTPLLKRLESKGWITKSRSKKDERVVNISLTEHGEAMHQEISDHVQTCFEILGMSKTEMIAALKVIDKVSSKLDEVDTQALKVAK